MGLYDQFVGALQCTSCEFVTSQNTNLEMQTKIQDEPTLSDLSIGMKLDVSFEEVELAGYLPLQSKAQPDSFAILHRWICPSCKSPNFARILIQNEIITEMTTLPYTAASLDMADFVCDELLYQLDIPPDCISKPTPQELVDRLREYFRQGRMV